MKTETKLYTLVGGSHDGFRFREAARDPRPWIRLPVYEQMRLQYKDTTAQLVDIKYDHYNRCRIRIEQHELVFYAHDQLSELEAIARLIERYPRHQQG